jgi:hypothetical protein
MGIGSIRRRAGQTLSLKANDQPHLTAGAAVRKRSTAAAIFFIVSNHPLGFMSWGSAGCPCKIRSAQGLVQSFRSCVTVDLLIYGRCRSRSRRCAVVFRLPPERLAPGCPRHKIVRERGHCDRCDTCPVKPPFVRFCPLSPSMSRSGHNLARLRCPTLVRTPDG